MEQPKESNRGQAENEAGPFPVKKVVLSKTGIGYFEREDEVAGGQPFELFFKSGDMNDVLKSLTMVDLSNKSAENKAKVGGGLTFGKDQGKSTIHSSSDISAVGQASLVSSISYESTRPFDKQLDDLSISLNEHSSLRDLLGQVKGTPVQVEVLRHGKRDLVEGTVIGLERKSLVRPSRHEAYFLALLVEGKAVQYFNLGAVVKLRFMNELMQQDLRHLLTILLQAKKKDLKSVTGYTRGGGDKRNIRASYIVEAPVWKTTYRLLFNTKKEVKSIIEGWALVDNTQNEDWRGVELSLVSGASNSFIYDLYNPRYAARTEARPPKPILPRGHLCLAESHARRQIEVEQEETLAPPTLEDAVAQHDVSALVEATATKDERKPMPIMRAKAEKEKCKKKMKSAAPMMKMQCAAAPMASRARQSRREMAPEAEIEHCYDDDDDDEEGGYGGTSPAPPPEEFSRTTASSSVEVNSEAKKMEMADLFQYKITSAVNVNRNQSALVPFLHTEFHGVKASVYNKGCGDGQNAKNVREDNPLAVIKFKNTFGDDVYVGESMLPRVKVNEEIYAAYAVDLKTTVTMTDSSELRDVYQADAAQYEWEKGRLTLRRWKVYEFTYVVDNKNDHAIDHFYLEHPKSATELIETPEPDERLAHFYRFKLVVPARQVVKFVVKEQEQSDETYPLDYTDKAQAEEWFAAGYIPSDVKKTLDAIVKRGEKSEEFERQITTLHDHKSSLEEDINRIDRCLGSLALSDSGFYAEQSKFRDFFTKELNAIKTEHAKVEKQVAKLEKKSERNDDKKESLAQGIRFLKKIPAKSTAAGTTKKN
ncbi:uncharacterized protein ACA1_095690 [Acanthamoeba castellanii str. Neff]|uniref:DUF4139 domain-containing protein n=1 Tax=Acanthamoeba castellanii (strain ATCC 30010 / Neff) TaxID=1257118 RepID=L8GJ92_ACACF|nr:uncharacterized protein ACA1_095690 [Acanthamoeba castellanii str. Neff]ELR12919.1 hypothetical protein ACA1_095690 [Acanthamoeba castellanii str. Neff]